MKSIKYKALCTAKVLAIGDRIYKDEVVRFTIKEHLPIIDFGTYPDTGWEYEVDDSKLYHTWYYDDKQMEDMELIRPNDIIKISRSRNIDLKKILSVVITEIDLSNMEDLNDD